MEKYDDTEDHLVAIQRTFGNAAGKVAHHTKAEREKMMSTPENVRLREKTAARCTARIKRRMPKKQARKIRTKHHVRYCSEPVKKEANRKPLTELFVKGQFTEDREEWQKELLGHCEDVYTDLEETKEVHESRIEYFKQKGDQQFTEEGRSAEITVDLVLQAGAKLRSTDAKT